MPSTEIETWGSLIILSPFGLLKTAYRGDVMTVHLLDNYKKTVRMVAYLVSTKQVPQRTGTCISGHG